MSFSTIELERQKAINSTPRIDSYGVMFAEKDLLHIDYKMAEKPVFVYETTGETIEKDIPAQPQIFHKDGIKLRFTRFHIPRSDYFEGGYFIRVVITSKMLKQKYFDGLQFANIDTIVDFINSTNIIRLNAQILLSAKINDIDICRNYYANDDHYSRNLASLYKAVKQSKRAYVAPFKSKKNDPDNKGLVFGHERKQGTWSNPFIKFYNKANELYTKSKDFYTSYLSNAVKQNKITLLGLRRFEITIKNSDHKRKLVKTQVIPENALDTVRDLYNISGLGLRQILHAHIDKYFEVIPRFKRGIELSTQDNMIAYFLDLAIKNGASKNVLDDVLMLAKSPTEKNRIKDRYTRLYNYVVDSDYMEMLLDNNNDFSDFLDFLDLSHLKNLEDQDTNLKRSSQKGSFYIDENLTKRKIGKGGV